MPILILVICALALYIDFMPGAKFVLLTDPNSGFGHSLETKLGLDLRGGFSATYQALPVADSTGKLIYPSSGDMSQIRTIIENRVNGTGIGEIVVETKGSDQLTVEVPGATNPDQIQSLVGQQGLLTFIPLDRATYGYMNVTATGSTPVAGTKTVPNEGTVIDSSAYPKPLFDGKQVDGDPNQTHAFYDTAASTPLWTVVLHLKTEAAATFATWSAANIGNYFMIVMDNTVISAPYIREAIPNGTASISGSMDKTSATNLATVLQYGALPFPLNNATFTQIPATLGKTFMDQTLFAGAIGIGLVMLFMLIYYRLPGAVACIALTYYGIAVLAIFRIVPVTLSLAGIAGFVLSVGMAVDANILIFERTKEELRSGKTLQSAMEAGFNRALTSIIDSNVSTLITATILYFGGSPTVKGFALVLAIGVLASMFTAVTVSRRMLRLVVHQEFAQHAWLYGVTDEEFKARAVRMGRREARGRV